MTLERNKVKTLLIVANIDWFLISHRLIIAKAAVKAGWRVIVACEDTGRGSEISVEGIEFIDFKFSRSGTNPIDELKTIIKFKKFYKRVQPDIIHHISIKPVVYGSYAAKKLGSNIGVVNAISGLGYAFTDGRVGLVQKLIIRLMRYGFKQPNLSVIFQNNDDKQLLIDHNVIQPENTLHLIKGSGVDLEVYSFTKLPKNKERLKILFPARMLWDKGVAELREATEFLQDKFANKVQFLLAGFTDEGNKAGVPSSYLNAWQDGEYVKWLGHQSNMVELYKECDIVVLPSYREGLPKALIEACAIGRPIVTTNAIGCKDCVDEGINGFKVPTKSGVLLAEALEKLITDEGLRGKMSLAGRKKAEAEFDVKSVIKKHLDIYKSLLKST